MYKIPIFRAEKDAGLSESIQANASVAYVAMAELSTEFAVPEALKKTLSENTKASTKDFDLHYLKSILVTAGVWNKNDDVFDGIETWAARATPEDKPFNNEHDCAQIIGHITSNYVLDDAGRVVADDSTADALPAKFHVVTGAVLYKYWDKPELQKRMDDILKEVAKGERYVSMEVLFKGFDYAVVDKEGVARVVARNEKTAFLTKHLRAYGGNGVFEECKVGRVLRNMVFSGKGLVKKPANPESIIFSDSDSVSFASANLSNNFYPKENLGYVNVTSHRRDLMSQAEIEKLQKEFADLKAKNDQLETSLRENDVKQVKAQLDAVQTEKNKGDELLKASSTKLLEIETAHEQVKKSFIAAQAELDTVKAEQKKTSRIAYVVKSLSFDESKAAEQVADLSTLSDEAFNRFIDNLAKAIEVKLPPKVTDAKLPPKVTDAKLPPRIKASETETEVDPAEANADAVVLEKVEPEKTIALSTTEVDAGVDKLREDVAKYLSKV